ncbi:hypothetical protein PIIN_04954 [Serendipita indica DSM 11827]|uniref:Oxidoreductase-like domain-containing protein n=1 Tax=Serendipita indica (strain DSM 11827) TaxID=1109443 RepID=G4TI77_SERID|nr:hypothetical protein PIIN_04954 [Serendipita indica DSM 11827]
MGDIPRVVLRSIPRDARILLTEKGACRRLPNSLQWPVQQRRHAHNLSQRFKALETKIRPAEMRDRIASGEVYRQVGLDGSLTSKAQPPAIELEDSEQAERGPEMELFNKGGSKSILRPKPRLFKGVLIPIKPPPPASDECCMSSCAVCVYDLYATALEDYQESMERARNELSAKGVPQSDWPTDVLTDADRERRLQEERERQKSEGGLDAGRRMGVTGESEHDKQMAVIIGAFVKFEQSLREKRRAEKDQGQTNG